MTPASDLCRRHGAKQAIITIIMIGFIYKTVARSSIRRGEPFGYISLIRLVSPFVQYGGGCLWSRSMILGSCGHEHGPLLSTQGHANAGLRTLNAHLDASIVTSPFATQVSTEKTLLSLGGLGHISRLMF